MAPTADLTIENWLSTFGIVDYELIDVPVEEWDRERSLHNQARLTDTPLTDEVMLNYALAMSRGETFPPVIVSEGASGYIAIDGNHRFAAAQIADQTSLPGYVVRHITEPQRLLLTFDANARHGMRTTTPERIQQALTLIANGVTVTNAANTLNVNVSTLQGHANAHQTRAELTRAGVDVSRVAHTALARIANIASRPVRISFARWATTARLGVDEVNEHVTRINGFESEAEQMAYIDEQSRERQTLLAATANGRATLPGSLRHLTTAITHIDDLQLDQLTEESFHERTTPETRQLFVQRTTAAIAKMRRVVTALNA